MLEAHREIAKKIADTRNAYGETTAQKYDHENGAATLYYIGCTSRYREPEIVDSMIAILEATGVCYFEPVREGLQMFWYSGTSRRSRRAVPRGLCSHVLVV